MVQKSNQSSEERIAEVEISGQLDTSQFIRVETPSGERVELHVSPLGVNVGVEDADEVVEVDSITRGDGR